MTRTLRTTIFATALAATLGLAACGSPAGEEAPEVPAATPTDGAVVTPEATAGATGAATPTQGQDSTQGGTDSGSDADATTNEQEVLDAIAAAEAAVPGTRAIDLDREDNGNKYEIDVTDGVTVTELDVIGGVATITDTDDLDGDDRAEFEAATVTIQEAISIALAEWPGIVDDIELDDDDDSVSVRWEFDVIVDGAMVEFWVDAATGELGR